MAIKSVVRHVKFSPDIIDKMYVDEIDHHGLIYWYNDALDYSNQIKKSIKKED